LRRHYPHSRLRVSKMIAPRISVELDVYENNRTNIETYLSKKAGETVMSANILQEMMGHYSVLFTTAVEMMKVETPPNLSGVRDLAVGLKDISGIHQKAVWGALVDVRTAKKQVIAGKIADAALADPDMLIGKFPEVSAFIVAYFTFYETVNQATDATLFEISRIQSYINIRNKDTQHK